LKSLQLIKAQGLQVNFCQFLFVPLRFSSRDHNACNQPALGLRTGAAQSR
jgi:hypothetical protein